MTIQGEARLGKALWDIAKGLGVRMSADEFRDYMLSLLVFRCLSDTYEQAARTTLGADYPDPGGADAGGRSSLSLWYERNPGKVPAFEEKMRGDARFVLRPEHLWANVSHLARSQDPELLDTLQAGLTCIESESGEGALSGIFSEVDLQSSRLGNSPSARNEALCKIVDGISEGLAGVSLADGALGDEVERMIDRFSARSRFLPGEYYTPRGVSDIMAEIVTLDGRDPGAGRRKRLESVMDFACGTGSLLLNVRERMGDGGVGKVFGQDKYAANCNMARMNMLLHGLRDAEFEIFHGDTLTNEWDMLRETNPAKRPRFDAVVASPPFTRRWNPREVQEDDPRFETYGLAPTSVADFAFLLHGLHFLKDDGVMALAFHPGILFREGEEADIRSRLLKDGRIDAVILLPDRLFYSSGSRSCILVLKKCDRPNDVLFIHAAWNFETRGRRHYLSREQVDRIVETYRQRPERVEGFARRVELKEIEANDFKLDPPLYIRAKEGATDLSAKRKELAEIERQIRELAARYHASLKELGLPPGPVPGLPGPGEGATPFHIAERRLPK